MATNCEALDVLEDKIKKLELKVYGDKFDITYDAGSIIDSLLQANTMMTAALSGKEKFAKIFKRLHELNDYMELNPFSIDLIDLNSKVNIIFSMKEELESTLKNMEKINELKSVLNDDKIKNTQLLKDDLTDLQAMHFTTKEKLIEITNEINEIILKFNEICLEISKSFFILNEALTKMESKKK